MPAASASVAALRSAWSCPLPATSKTRWYKGYEAIDKYKYPKNLEELRVNYQRVIMHFKGACPDYQNSANTLDRIEKELFLFR
jgi:hypothetical protein